MGKSVAITGRRPEGLPWGDNEYSQDALYLKNRLKYRISDLLDEGYDTYYVGMARGIDTYIVEILLDLRSSQSYSNICINAVIPYRGFADHWKTLDRKRFYELLALCDSVKVMSEEVSKGAIFVRNKYMVDNSDIVLAVYDNIKNGGTYNTLLYAKSQGKKIIIEEI